MLKKVLLVLSISLLCASDLNADVIKVSTPDELNSAIAGKKAVVKVYATWCGFCKTIAPEFEKLSNEYTDIVFVEAEAATDAAKDWMKKHNITGFPHTTFHNANGTVVATVHGGNVNGIKNETAKLAGKATPMVEEKPMMKKKPAKKAPAPKKKKMPVKKQKTEKKPRRAKKDADMQRKAVGCKNDKCTTCTDNTCTNCTTNDCATCGK